MKFIILSTGLGLLVAVQSTASTTSNSFPGHMQSQKLMLVSLIGWALPLSQINTDRQTLKNGRVAAPLPQHLQQTQQCTNTCTLGSHIHIYDWCHKWKAEFIFDMGQMLRCYGTELPLRTKSTFKKKCLDVEHIAVLIWDLNVFMTLEMKTGDEVQADSSWKAVDSLSLG